MSLPSRGVGFGYIVDVPLLLSYCDFLFVFGCRIFFFLYVPVFFIDDCSVVSCHVDVPLEE